MKKRICAVLLVLSLILSFALLAGCEKDDSPEFVKIEDGDKTISVTENDLDGLNTQATPEKGRRGYILQRLQA